MNRGPLHAIGVLLLLALVEPVSAQPRAQTVHPKATKPAQLEPHEIAERLKESLVAIETRDKDGRRLALGSGFFIDKRTILTNLHVFKWAHSASVKIVKDGIRVDAQRVQMLDRLHDLCTFTVEHEGIPVKIASQIPRVGDPVYAIGNPLGLEATFSSGMVTALRANKIQIDAPISHGSSGGPVANNKAEVIGVSTAIMNGGQNLNFVVPLSYLNKNVDNLTVDVTGRIAVVDAEFDRLSGSVKSVKTWGSEYVRGEFLPARLTSVEEYDSLGNETSSCFYDNKGGSSCYEYERENDTFITRRHHRQGTIDDPARNYDHKQALSFEASRHPIGMEVESQSGLDRQVEVYDGFGNWIESRTNGITTFLRVYDEVGIVMERTKLNVFKNITFRSRYRYEFDANGNWVKQLEEAFFPDSPQAGWITQRVTTREIEYW